MCVVLFVVALLSLKISEFLFDVFSFRFLCAITAINDFSLNKNPLRSKQMSLVAMKVFLVYFAGGFTTKKR